MEMGGWWICGGFFLALLSHLFRIVTVDFNCLGCVFVISSKSFLGVYLYTAVVIKTKCKYACNCLPSRIGSVQ